MTWRRYLCHNTDSVYSSNAKAKYIYIVSLSQSNSILNHDSSLKISFKYSIFAFDGR